MTITAGLWFVIRAFAGPAPKTMTKEWQEATNEYAKVRYIFSLLCFVAIFRP